MKVLGGLDGSNTNSAFSDLSVKTNDPCLLGTRGFIKGELGADGLEKSVT